MKIKLMTIEQDEIINLYTGDQCYRVVTDGASVYLADNGEITLFYRDGREEKKNFHPTRIIDYRGPFGNELFAVDQHGKHLFGKAKQKIKGA